ncbi:MAG: GDSL-type esterase/lipase family protein [Actinomycetota bacterium]
MSPGNGQRSVALAVVFAGLIVLGACTTASTGSSSDPGAGSGSGAGAAAAGDAVAVPLPTIGLGSDTGSGSSNGADTADAADGIERVVMIGDSITVGATPYLLDGFEAIGLPVEIGAKQGKRIDVNSNGNPGGTQIAQEFADGVGAGDDVLWVVALGTNDIGQYDDQADVETEIRELLAFVPDDAPLVWINTWFRDRPEATVMVNGAIESVLRGRGGATIADWATVAPGDGVLRDDGVHPNDDGAQLFADLVVGTVRTVLRR